MVVYLYLAAKGCVVERLVVREVAVKWAGGGVTREYRGGVWPTSSVLLTTRDKDSCSVSVWQRMSG